MWICLSNAFFSVVAKSEDPPDYLRVRARRAADIFRVFGRRPTFQPRSDYAWHCRVPLADVQKMLSNEIRKITYENFKDTVGDDELHNAYVNVWSAMSRIQKTAPFTGAPRDPAPTTNGKPWVGTRKRRWKTDAELNDPVPPLTAPIPKTNADRKWLEISQRHQASLFSGVR